MSEKLNIHCLSADRRHFSVPQELPPDQWDAALSFLSDLLDEKRTEVHCPELNRTIDAIWTPSSGFDHAVHLVTVIDEEEETALEEVIPVSDIAGVTTGPNTLRLSLTNGAVRHLQYI